MKYWKTLEGKKIEVKKMEDSHLQFSLRLMEEKKIEVKRLLKKMNVIAYNDDESLRKIKSLEKEVKLRNLKKLGVRNLEEKDISKVKGLAKLKLIQSQEKKGYKLDIKNIVKEIGVPKKGSGPTNTKNRGMTVIKTSETTISRKEKSDRNKRCIVKD